MKKQIALIIISMLAAMSVNAQNVNQKEMCNIRHKTPICEAGEGVIQPDLEAIFGTCPEFPEAPEKPEIPEVPETPEEPEIPEVPETPEEPEIPEVPETPEEPEVPEVPETPEEPEVPEMPEIPELPEIPDAPQLPEFPELPETEQPDDENQVPESSYELQVLNLVNAERAKYGLSSLTYDAKLSACADIRAKEIKTYFSHTRPNGQSCFTVLDEQGYSYRGAGENIAYGQSSPSEVMNAWMNSSGHRANILGENYTHIGIGVYEVGGVIYWSQMFSY